MQTWALGVNIMDLAQYSLELIGSSLFASVGLLAGLKIDQISLW